jgi:hypothetical protein
MCVDCADQELGHGHGESQTSKLFCQLVLSTESSIHIHRQINCHFRIPPSKLSLHKFRISSDHRVVAAWHMCFVTGTAPPQLRQAGCI